MKRIVPILIFLVVTTGSVLARDINSAGELADDCRAFNQSKLDNAENSFSAGICAGYMMAFAHIIAGDDIAGYTWTFAPGTTQGQDARVFAKYMDANPEEENKMALEAVLSALVKAHLLSATPTKKALVVGTN